MTVAFTASMVVAPMSAAAQPTPSPTPPACTIGNPAATSSQILSGTPGIDVICGGTANDLLSGGGADILNGGGGNPTNDRCFPDGFPFGPAFPC